VLLEGQPSLTFALALYRHANLREKKMPLRDARNLLKGTEQPD
jgi:hypothetical protein